MSFSESRFIPGWEARLALDYTCIDGRSVLARRVGSGPLAVQKTLYPEGDKVCHNILLHPPGGIAGGDALYIRINQGQKSQSVVTTPGAAKWYRSCGPQAVQDLHFNVADEAALEWLPLETIIFNGANANMFTVVNLAHGATYLGWDITCLGRTASGEEFESGRLRQTTEVHLSGKKIWGEYTLLEGDDPMLSSPAGLAGFTVVGTLLAVGKSISAEQLAQCREITADDDGRTGITTVPNVLAARYLGHSSEKAKNYFVALWGLLRPWFVGRVLCRPRIWNT